ncbi:MAG TPA: biotin--[acetyl-CoA-carboxylase] ligase [Candidatus Eisenbacteria bacterium]|nr:biotin--[acetyl-CoA-carboxylase] ligase [Candidatus Eisenbacteria bacterium]
MLATALVPSRLRWVGRVRSTNDVVRDWLRAGTPEVCVAVADEQTAGRGRNGRTWTAPPGAALLCSLGFRPTWLAPDRAWQLAAIVALAMADAAEGVSSLSPGAIRLKWPNDLVIERDGGVAKVAGVLGETDGLGGHDPQAVIGIGINAAWRRVDFPPEIAAEMTSLLEVSGRDDIDRRALLDMFLAGLEPKVRDLQVGRFDGRAWADRQLTSGRPVRLELPDGAIETVLATGVDPATGALVVADREGRERQVLVGEIRHLRVNGARARV